MTKMSSGFNLSDLGVPPLPNHNSDTIGALLWAREVLQDHLKSTYAVTGPEGIDELSCIKIGGVDQWLHIRGRNRKNPVLLYLHGGPGTAMIGWMDAIQRPWEDYFTIVQWDQRQTGKSYYPADDDNNPLTVARFVEDTEEVIQHLQRYLNQKKLFVLGHSWGTVLGMYMVKKHPDWLHAYIGLGQVVNMMDNEKTIYERLLAHAIRLEEKKLVSKLKAIGPYPNLQDPGRSFIEQSQFVRWELSRIAGETMMHRLPHDGVVNYDEALKIISLDRLTSPHLSLTDISNFVLGDKIALFRPPHLTSEFMKIDLPNEIGSTFEAPVIFFTGRHDWHTPRVLSDKWHEEITSPHKELVHFNDSCHFVINEEPGRFLTALVNKVLPLANVTA